MAATSLRSVIGDIPLDDVLSQRERINETLRLKLDEVTERWGGKVTTVEIREILPPPAVQEAMNRQLSAERTRRAVITESEGTRQATINVAEGDKQSAILRAEGDRQAAILRAQGFSEALHTIFQAARGIDQKTMTLQYLDALKALGSGPATKFVIPLEFTQLLGPVSSMIQSGMGKGPDGQVARPAAGATARNRQPGVASRAVDRAGGGPRHDRCLQRGGLPIIWRFVPIVSSMGAAARRLDFVSG